jgi:hypothetical protein
VSDVSTLQRHIDAERTKFLGLREKLMTTLGHFKAPPETPDHLISYAEEFGPAHAVKKLGEDPKHFGVDVPPAVRQEIAPLVLSLVRSSNSLDGLVGRREDILAKTNPDRKRVYIHYGREFTFDVAKGTMTFLDAPGKAEPLNLQVVHTKDQPEKGPGPSRSKKRDRSM